MSSARKDKVGFVGLGVMGASMCGHLLASGFDTTVYSRTTSKCQPLVDLGATLGGSPKDVAAASDVVFTMVGFPSEVEAVVMGEDGVLAEGGLAAGGVVVDMSTTPPALSEAIAAAAERRGCSAIDAPVSGGDVGARAGTLSVMAGGGEEAFARVLPLLECMGSTIALMGPAGAGQRTKAVNQTVIASSMVAMAEGLVLAHRAGLDAAKVVDVIAGGAAASFSLKELGPRMLRGNLDPGFYVEHFVKDLGIALELSRSHGLRLRGLEVAEGLYRGMQDAGEGKLGTQSLALAVERAAERESELGSVVGSAAEGRA